jgi:hypothetical protein
LMLIFHSCNPIGRIDVVLIAVAHKFEREPLDHTVVVYYYAPEQTEVHQGLFEYIPPLI